MPALASAAAMPERNSRTRRRRPRLQRRLAIGGGDERQHHAHAPRLGRHPGEDVDQRGRATAWRLCPHLGDQRVDHVPRDRLQELRDRREVVGEMALPKAGRPSDARLRQLLHAALGREPERRIEDPRARVHLVIIPNSCGTAERASGEHRRSRTMPATGSVLHNRVRNARCGRPRKGMPPGRVLPAQIGRAASPCLREFGSVNVRPTRIAEAFGHNEDGVMRIRSNSNRHQGGNP